MAVHKYNKSYKSCRKLRRLTSVQSHLQAATLFLFVIGYYFVVVIVSRRCVFEFDQVRMRERMTSQLI